MIVAALDLQLTVTARDESKDTRMKTRGPVKTDGDFAESRFP